MIEIWKLIINKRITGIGLGCQDFEIIQING